MTKRTERVFKCGIKGKQWSSYNTMYVEISLIDLYEGYGDTNNLKKLSDLFAELHDEGYVAGGMQREMGYYDSFDDLLLRCRKNKS